MSPSRRQRDAVPAYLRISAHLEGEIAAGRMPSHTKLPPERILTARFSVNRYTVRAALQRLRDKGLVVTDRRGTYVAGAVAASGADSAASHVARAAFTEAEQAVPVFPVDVADCLIQGRLFSAPVSAAMAGVLGIAPVRPALVHHQRAVTVSGEPMHEAVTRFTPMAVMEVPELSRYMPRLPVTDPDLRLFHQWTVRAGFRPAVRETITLTRHDTRPGSATSPELTVRRYLRDQRGRLLAVTDLTFHHAWQQITLDYTDPVASTHCVQAGPPC
ncbi:GntR family transcriptional regulator [Streptomyces sp. NBC_01619]|uniref:GntR family transcriptional regulator n=1 Tax=Streptomyces pratisoli TaxID=3139917 RepID=A0ACC6QBW5_9ACTN|nr:MULTISPECIES: GntR family transcriptional regulator [unclassified Streptomyces]MCX4510396.1 GntR family transcriptional regulator [Streptomyces sp. NBC_01619]